MAEEKTELAFLYLTSTASDIWLFLCVNQKHKEKDKWMDGFLYSKMWDNTIIFYCNMTKKIAMNLFNFCDKMQRDKIIHHY